jgi:adenylate cyclase
MFTDIVGYTALTQRNESETMRLLEEHRKLIRPSFVSHGGREVKTIGDAFLVEFQSALDAVLCAVAIQHMMHDRRVARGDTLSLRIGIHIGDVIEGGNDILGDAVNIASRIEPLAEPGGICVSDEAYKQVRNKSDLRFVSLGEKPLKNVTMPVGVYKVVMPWDEGQTTAQSTKLDSRRIAILPFVSMSPDPNDEYFADGMTEELIDRLAQVKALKVIARTSVMSYKGEKKKASAIAKELEVGSLVEGSVRKAANRVRVTVQLISAINEEHLWSSHYDGTLDDIFAVQSDIATKVAGELKVQLLDSERRTISKKPTEDTVAYTYYLQGKQLLGRMEEVPLRDALRLFGQALARDPRFAKAQAGIAECYNGLANWGYISNQEGIDKGREAALKALEIDPDLAEAHYGLALVMFAVNEVMECMRETRKALELNPNLAEAYQQLSEMSAAIGDTQEMVRAAEKAYQLDPLSPRAVALLGNAYFWTGRGEEAMEHWKKTLHLDPLRTYRNMFDYYASRGEYEEAEKTVRELERMRPDNPYALLNRGYLAALTGDEKTARDTIARLEKKGAGWSGASLAGFIFLPLGDMDKFFEYMLRAAEDGTLFASTLRCSPLFEKARKDPRIVEVFRRSGLPSETPT